MSRPPPRPPHATARLAARVLALSLAAGAGCSQSDADKNRPPPGPTPPLAASASAATSTALAPEEVSFPSDGRTLRGYLFKPDAAPPFPVVVWNHGSEREQPKRLPLAHTYLPRGYALFLPHRRGHGLSPGEYIVDEQRRLGEAEADPGRRDLKIIALHEAHVDDTLAAVAWVARQPFADPKRVAVSGASFGGIQTVLAAERESAARAFVAFAPAAMMWKDHPGVRERLVRAAANARRPLFVAQAENDFDTGPSAALGGALANKGGPSRAKVFPPFGASREDGHGYFAVRGGDVWGPDVFAFLDAAFRVP